MRQTWRWFGPGDQASIGEIRQAGAEGIVTALHHVPAGDVWTPTDIAKRKNEVERVENGDPSGLTWDVVESLPVSEDIKTQTGDWRAHIDNYSASLRNLAAAGIEVVCYNFMPVLDWTRTDLAYKLSHGGTCMRFDLIDFVAFDIGILKRPAAENDFSESVRKAASDRLAKMSGERKKALASNVASGLPGGAAGMGLEDLRANLKAYDGISAETLKRHLIDFLKEVIPVAEELGIRLGCHPDDPPFSLLGLPRIMSTEADYTDVLTAVDSPANGITLCSGSLGARPDNDLVGIMDRLGHRVHFLHLRNVKRESGDVIGSFHEAEHLGGSTDMVPLIAAILREERRRAAEGRADASIPMRPDHGQHIVDDLKRRTQPGYPLIGRLKGLAELRGVMTALDHSLTRDAR